MKKSDIYIILGIIAFGLSLPFILCFEIGYAEWVLKVMR